jgi:hypothetical protein
MNSKIPDELLSAFLDRELTAAEEAAVSKQLKNSPQARQELQDYQRLAELLHELPRLKVPAEFAASVMQRAERETLIPLDPVATVDRSSSSRKLSRRALALTAIGAVAASITLLMIVDRPRPQGEEALVAKTVEVNGPQGLGLRTTLKGSANAPAAAAELHTESPAPSAAPAAAAQNTATAATILSVAPAFKTAAADNKPVKASASVMWGRATDGNGAELVLPADLKKAKVGDVIEAMEKVGNQVAVVRLTVVDQTAGLGQLQSLLWREPSHSAQQEGTARGKQQVALREKAVEYESTSTFGEQKQKSAGGSQQMKKNKAGELICVFIEESREELADLLKDMQAERPFQQAELTSTISVEKLAQYANHPVAPSAAAHSTSHAPTVLSLPAKAVNQIYADNGQTPDAADKKDASPQVTSSFGFSDASKSQAVARKSPTTGTTAFGEDRRVASADKNVRSRQLSAGGPAQRPIQVFFVLDDQSVAQSESESTSKASGAPVALPALESQSDKPLYSRPVRARRPAKHRADPSQKAE